MSINPTLENKNTVTPTLEAKGPNTTWDEANYTWDNAVGTWDLPGTVVSVENKNSVSLTLENKN